MPRAIHSTTAFIIVAFLLFFLGFMLKTLVGAETIQDADANRALPEAAADDGSRIAPPLRLSSLRINRTENGLTLGDSIVALRSSGRAVEAGKAASGAELLALLPRYLPKGAARMLGVYMDGRLAAITTSYRQGGVEIWDSLLAAATAKYGEAVASAQDVRKWTDGQVVLVLKKEDAGLVSATLAFIDSLQKHYSRVGPRAPGS
ncbi:MAG TPA: hypothetical protein VGH50_05265 [Candidatus Binatia bacterium]|jgi:hypothetical protein